MAYMDYKFNKSELFSDIAYKFNTTVDNIMKINNISPPYVSCIKDLDTATLEKLNGTLLVPVIYSGGNSTDKNLVTYRYYNNSFKNKSFSLVNIRPGRAFINCYIIVNGDKVQIPCYPESVSDSNTASYSSVNPLGRSEPFQIYNNSGPRSVSVSFTMHCEMVGNYEYVPNLVKLIESATYPNYDNAVSAVKCTLVIGKSIKITGIITNTETRWYGPIIDEKYQMVDISFSVTECTGNPKSQSQIKSMGGYR